MSYATKLKDRVKRKNCAPPMIKCSRARRMELQALLLTIASRIAEAATLAALVKQLDLNPDRTSHWLHWGEVSPWPAAEMLKQHEVWRRKELKKGKQIEEITLRQLVPSLFPPE